jgi:hypothetical protein
MEGADKGLKSTNELLVARFERRRAHRDSDGRSSDLCLKTIALLDWKPTRRSVDREHELDCKLEDFQLSMITTHQRLANLS